MLAFLYWSWRRWGKRLRWDYFIVRLLDFHYRLLFLFWLLSFLIYDWTFRRLDKRCMSTWNDIWFHELFLDRLRSLSRSLFESLRLIHFESLRVILEFQIEFLRESFLLFIKHFDFLLLPLKVKETFVQLCVEFLQILPLNFDRCCLKVGIGYLHIVLGKLHEDILVLVLGLRLPELVNVKVEL